MITYEEKVIKELEQWKATFMKDSSMMTRFSKKVQTKVQQLIPAKVQKVLTETIRMMVQTISAGSNFIKPKLKETTWSLQRRDDEVRKKMDEYKKIAAAEGAGTGAGAFSLNQYSLGTLFGTFPSPYDFLFLYPTFRLLSIFLFCDRHLKRQVGKREG